MAHIARNLVGRHILVSGGANGIGKASVQRFAAQGANVSISDLNKSAGDDLTAELRETYPGQGFAFDEVDVTDAQAVQEHVTKVASSAPQGIAGLLCAAGIAPPGPRMHEVNLEVYQRVINVNMNGTYYYNSSVLREMVSQNARHIPKPDGGYTIVNIGSKASVEGLPGAAAYCATKHAVLGFSRVNAKDYANENIRINVLCPGVTATDLVKKLMASGQAELSEEHTIARVYARRLGNPEEMAAAASFLIGPESSYMTGQALVVDGMWMP